LITWAFPPSKATDKNESDAINNTMMHLGQQKSNPVLGVFPKNITGHPKGAAGALIMNLDVHVFNSRLVPSD